MKRYGFLVLSIVIAFTMLANNILPPDTSTSSNSLVLLIKTPTKKPVATKTPPKKKIRVKAIIKQVLYYGNGGDDYLRDDETGCMSFSSSGDTPAIIEPMLLWTPTEVKQTEYVRLFSCLWEEDKDVSANILKPDGIIQTEEIEPSSSGNVEFFYSPTAFDPLGTYKVIFSNGEQSLDVEFKVKRTTEPGIAVIAKDYELQVYNFRPYESITVFQYEQSTRQDPSIPNSTLVFDATLKGWQDLETGRDGSLRLNITDVDAAYVVIGERTGEFNVNWNGMHKLDIVSTDTPTVSDTPLCPGAAVSRVAVGSTTRVTTRTRIRAQAALSGSMIKVVSKDDLFIILDGHKCSDGYTWWYGLIGSGIKGWMAESQNGTYLLEPVQ